jgi:hypothetical protein
VRARFSVVFVCLITAACAKSKRDDGAGAAGSGAESGSAGTGSGGAAGTTSTGGGGGDAGKAGAAGAGGAGSSAGGDGNAGEASGASGSGGSGAAGAAGAPSEPCPGHQGFITIVGELPYFGEDVSLTDGCANALEPYPGVASYLGGPGEGTGDRVTVASCSEDQSLNLSLVLDFDENAADAGNTSGLKGGSLRFNGEATSSIRITEFVETARPVESWTDVTLGTDAGVGKIYSGSFAAAGDVFGTAASVTGTFSACHVANLR